ncbi:phosphotransferase family protein [Schlegelella sp. ID0723]|uniref:Phosphotransferase family protein n=2 Tax=Piscinibacter koreensis TaxID=2742824 RepID=A0A7Y6NN53_9BURK|nr:phosphotransferase family protein [Schlegelella koreensis]
MRRIDSPLGEVRSLQRVTGGATKRTWSFDWHAAGHVDRLILQTVDALPARRHGPPKLAAAEDAALMVAARRAGVAAPVVRHVLQPDDALGDGTITERVDGETLGRKVVHDPALAPARRRLAAQCGAALARIHRMPPGGLGFLQRLSPADELATYGALLAEHDLGDPALAYALRWVGANLPRRWDVGVVHADFRTGNLIVGPEGLACILDWEIARIGDPMQDLAVLCLRTWRFGGAGEVGGFGSRAELYAAYEAAGGRVDVERVRFWEAFSNLKWAISCVRRGLATRADGRPASLELAAVGRRLEEPLWDFLALARSVA